MQPIKDLKMEHDAVQLTLRILDKICQKIEQSGEIIDHQHLDLTFRQFVFKCCKLEITSNSPKMSDF